MRKSRAFIPSSDGRLEDRLVLSGGRGNAVVSVASMSTIRGEQATSTQAVDFTTDRYFNIVTEIHRAFVAFGKSKGTTADVNRLLNSVDNQAKFIPFAVQDGLVSTLRTDIEATVPADFQSTYSVVRSDILAHLSTEVSSGAVRIVKTDGNHWTDKEIFGPNATFSNA